MLKNITVSIVLYKEVLEELQKAIDSVLDHPQIRKLYLIDNSPNNKIEEYLNDERIVYNFVGKNIGFGAGHNLILDKIKNKSDYHLILNPDTSFDSNILNELINQLEKDDELSLIAPKVLFPNGNLQNSCRRYPKFSEMFFRRFPFLKNFSKPLVEKGIYGDKDLNTPIYVDYLTGCFHLYRTKDLITMQGFDERYFLYMEDVDLCRKIDKLGKKKMYYPNVVIQHVLKQKSAKDLLLFIRHITSMIKYYKKWGF